MHYSVGAYTATQPRTAQALKQLKKLKKKKKLHFAELCCMRGLRVSRYTLRLSPATHGPRASATNAATEMRTESSYILYELAAHG